MHLTHRSYLLSTFNTDLGRYCFKTMPFGLRKSQDVFQMKMYDIVERCPHNLCTHDNLCVYGHTEKEHNTNMLNLIYVASNTGLVFKVKSAK